MTYPHSVPNLDDPVEFLTDPRQLALWPTPDSKLDGQSIAPTSPAPIVVTLVIQVTAGEEPK